MINNLKYLEELREKEKSGDIDFSDLQKLYDSYDINSQMEFLHYNFSSTTSYFVVKKPIEETNFFDFLIFALDGQFCYNGRNSYEFNNEHCFEVILSGRTYYDGVRHLELFPVNDGYSYYPDMNSICFCIQKINEMSERVRTCD